MIAIIIIAALLFIGFIILAITGKKEEEKVDKLCINELAQKGIHLNFQAKVQSGIIGMDQKNRKLIFIESNLSKPSYKIFAFEDIYSCELLKDNVIVSQKSTARTIGGAIIGDAIAGRAGMIVGGLSGGSHSKSIPSLIELKIVIKDIKSPIYKMTFYNKNINISSQFGGLAYEAEVWKNRINLIIEEIDLETIDQEEGTDESFNGNQSLADELAKLHELKQKGILTEEEFNAQKKKLLGL